MEGLKDEIERLKRRSIKREEKRREKKQKEGGIGEKKEEKEREIEEKGKGKKAIDSTEPTYCINPTPLVDSSVNSSDPTLSSHSTQSNSTTDLVSIPEVFNGYSCRQPAIPFDIPTTDSIQNKISLFLYRLLWDWYYLEEKKMGEEGDQLLFKQTVTNLNPFFQLLQSDKLNTSIVESIHTIVSNLSLREYVRANDEYLRLSIGNAPWPIGVSMVSIHERSSGQRIRSNQIGHVLNDELTRKWIQGIKRLMTICQRIYPNKNHSKMIG